MSYNRSAPEDMTAELFENSKFFEIIFGENINPQEFGNHCPRMKPEVWTDRSLSSNVIRISYFNPKRGVSQISKEETQNILPPPPPAILRLPWKYNEF